METQCVLKFLHLHVDTENIVISYSEIFRYSLRQNSLYIPNNLHIVISCECQVRINVLKTDNEMIFFATISRTRLLDRST